jgi:Fur family peroxide stress response transcriptional regulator
MDDAERRRRLEDFARLCRGRGLRCTVQRRVILEAMLGLDNHPTADQVYEAVLPRLPGVSRTTVYRTLESLAQMGVISKACHPGAVARYDSRTELHHHLICLHCDSVVDISDPGLDSVSIPDTSRLGFEVADFRVQLRGICRRCRQHHRREESP